MKKTIAIAFMAIATSVFGGQQDRLACAVTNSMQATDAIVRYYLEVHRAITNRIRREQYDREERLRLEIERAERAQTRNKAGAEASERNRKASEEPEKKPFNYKSGKNPPDRQQTPVEAKQKKEIK